MAAKVDGTVQLVTVFERIPDIFIEAYDAQLQKWARNFTRVGKRCAIMFDEPLPPLVISSDPRKVIGVWLKAEVDRTKPGLPRVVVAPSDDEAEALIIRHVHDLARRLH